MMNERVFRATDLKTDRERDTAAFLKSNFHSPNLLIQQGIISTWGAMKHFLKKF